VYQQPVYQQPQPVSQQPQVVYQQPQATTVAPAANTVPASTPAPVANTVPKVDTPPKPNLVPTTMRKPVAPKNQVGSKVAPASQALRGRIGKAIDKQVRQKAKDLERDVAKLGIDPDEISARVEDLAKGATEAQLKDLNAAIESGDSKKLDRILKTLKVPDADRREVTAKLGVLKAVQDFEEALRGGGGADSGAVAEAQEQLNDALDNFSKTKIGVASRMDDLRRDADDAARLAEIRDLARSRSGGPGDSGGWITTPDQILIVDDPGLPGGTMMALGPNLVVRGGGEGTLAVHPGGAADLGIPFVSGSPVPDAPSSGSGGGSGSGVLVTNPRESGGAIHYSVSNFPYEMKAGESQTLPAGRTWIIEFDRGQGQGKARYALDEGTYEFFVGARGWDLRGKTHEVTLDNSANAHEFHYVANGQADLVPARQSKTIQSKWPIVLDFDRGDGLEPVRKELAKGTYQVGVDFRTNLLELFPAQEGALAGRVEPAAPYFPRSN
jgi:hypothetical protein